MELVKAKIIAEKMLSEKRFSHSLNVAKKAKELALIYGGNIQKAELAGVLHDIMKEKSKDEMIETVSQNKKVLGWLSQFPVNVWHGPVAAEYLESTCGIKDKELLCAIACHTFGKRDMTKLDKIVYIADLVSQERNYPNVQNLRELAKNGLDNALLTIMKEHTSILKNQGKIPMPQTLESILKLEANLKKPSRYRGFL